MEETSTIEAAKTCQNTADENDDLEPVEMDMAESDEETNFANGLSLDQDSKTSDREVSDNDKTNVTVEQPISNQNGTRILQILNISPSATLEQISTFFGHLGDIVQIEFFQSDQNSENNFKVCFVEFANSSSALLAQHLTNTVFIDRALIVIPHGKQVFPDKDEALGSIVDTKLITNFDLGFINQVASGVNGAQVISTIDPRLTALGLSQYPNLPINTEPARIEEIRRTVYIGNLDSTLPPEEVLKFFNDIGEVKFIRMAGDDTQPTRFAFVEYTHQSSVANALQHNGVVLGSRALKINHSNNAIVKPQPKVLEVDDNAKRLRDNHPATATRDRHNITLKHDKESVRTSKDREKSRDHDWLRDTDRIKDYDRTSRDRPRDYDRSRDRDKVEDYDRLKDQDRVRDHGRDRYYGRRDSPRNSRSRRSRSRENRRRSKSRERNPSRRNKSRERDRRKRSRSRESKRRSSKDRTDDHSKSKRHRSRR